MALLKYKRPGWLPRRLLAVFHPKVWLTLFGGVFTLAYLLMALATDGGLYGVFRSNAVSQWSNATDAELDIATAYEGFWCGALLSLSLLALSFAWLFRGKTRATLALVFGTVMLACFLPGLIFVSSRYRLHCTPQPSSLPTPQPTALPTFQPSPVPTPSPTLLPTSLPGMFSVEEIKAIAESVGTATGAAVGSSMATAGPAGDPVSLIYIVQFVSVTNQVSGLPLSYGMMSDSFDWVNLKFNPPESMMRQACGGRKPCDESDPGFKGHAWTPDSDLTEGELGLKMKGIATFHMTGPKATKGNQRG